MRGDRAGLGETAEAAGDTAQADAAVARWGEVVLAGRGKVGHAGRGAEDREVFWDQDAAEGELAKAPETADFPITSSLLLYHTTDDIHNF